MPSEIQMAVYFVVLLYCQQQGINRLSSFSAVEKP